MEIYIKSFMCVEHFLLKVHWLQVNV